MKELKVLKKHYIKKDKEFNYYHVKGVARDKNFRTQLIAPNLVYYTLPHIIFNVFDITKLVVALFEMRDTNGKVIISNTYIARNVDENSDVYKCKILTEKVSARQYPNVA